MKKLNAFLVLVPALILSSCNKEQASEKTEEFVYTFTLGEEGPAQTRAALTYDEGNKCYYANWEAGDKLGAYTTNGVVNKESVINVDVNPVEFVITTAASLQEGDKVYTYFPFRPQEAGTPATAVEMEVPAVQDVRMNAMPMLGTPYTISNEVDGTIPVGSIKMQNLGGMFLFKPYSAEKYTGETVLSITFNATAGISGKGTVNITSDEPALTGCTGTSVQVLNANKEVAATKDDANAVQMVVAPGSYTGKVVVTTNKHIFTIPVSTPQSVDRSHIKALGINLDKVADVKDNQSGKQSITITVTDVPNTYQFGTRSSQAFQVNKGESLHIVFVNNARTSTNLYNNWCMAALSKADEFNYNNSWNADNYKRYFVLRCDAYAWGMVTSANLTNNYNECFNDWGGSGKDSFLDFMTGATVDLHVQYAEDGKCNVTATATKAGSDKVLVESYTCTMPSNTDSFYALLTSDNNSLTIKEAWKGGDGMTEDENPRSLAFTNLPESVPVGATRDDILSGVTATVTYSDGTNATANNGDIVLNLPDMSTRGEKVIEWSYNKTKAGKVGPAIYGSFVVQAVEPVIDVTATAYVIGKTASQDHVAKVTLGKENISVKLNGNPVSNFTVVSFKNSLDGNKTGIYDANIGLVEDAYKVEYNGKQYSGALDIKASTLIAQEGTVGKTDNTSGWESAFTKDWDVKNGESQTISFTLGSKGGENWHCANVVLQTSAKDYVYCAVRMDNYGWGDKYDANNRYSNWNWDVFKSNLNGSKVSITVSNVGGKAAIRYYVEYPNINNEQHYQHYTNLIVGGTVSFKVGPDSSHLVF